MNSGDIPWNEIALQWQLEPELRNPPPRRVKPRVQAPRRGCGERVRGCFGGGCLNLFLLFTLATGLFIGYWVGLAVLIEPFGTVATGRVTHHKYHGRTPYLGFEWRHEGRRYIGEAVAGEESFWFKQDGAPISVRYFPFAPQLRPVLEEDRLWWGFAVMLAPVSLILIGVGALPLLGMFPRRRKGKRLVARGIATPAFITRVRRTGSERLEVKFLYRAAGETLEGTVILGAGQSLPPRDQKIVTALFDPKNPHRVILYCGADYLAGP